MQNAYTPGSYTTYQWLGGSWQTLSPSNYNNSITDFAAGACTANTVFPGYDSLVNFFQSRGIPQNQTPAQYWPTGPPNPETCSAEACVAEKAEWVLQCGGEEFVDWSDWSDDTCITARCGDCTDFDQDGVCVSADPDDRNADINGDRIAVVQTTYKGSPITQLWWYKGDEGGARFGPFVVWAGNWNDAYYQEQEALHPGDFNTETFIGGNATAIGPRCGPEPACGETTPAEPIPELADVTKPPPPECEHADEQCTEICADSSVSLQVCVDNISSCTCENGQSTQVTTDPETGEVTKHEITPAGVEKTTTVNPDGSQTVDYTGPDGSGTVNSDPNGYGSGEYTAPDGTVTSITVGPGGVVTKTTTYPDGTKVETKGYGGDGEGLPVPAGNGGTGTASGTGSGTSLGSGSGYTGGSNTSGSGSGTGGTGGTGSNTTGSGSTGTGTAAGAGSGYTGGTVTTVTNPDGSKTTTVTPETKDKSDEGKDEAENITGPDNNPAPEDVESTVIDERVLDWVPVKDALAELEDKFPFSIPDQIQNQYQRFVSEGQAPVFDISLGGFHTDVDLSIFDPIAMALRVLNGIAICILFLWLLLKQYGAVK